MKDFYVVVTSENREVIKEWFCKIKKVHDDVYAYSTGAAYGIIDEIPEASSVYGNKWKEESQISTEEFKILISEGSIVKDTIINNYQIY